MRRTRIGKATDVTNMKEEKEIKKLLKDLEHETRSGGPFTEWQNVARKATKQALEWVLEETENPLTY
jgi:hypothetical protein